MVACILTPSAPAFMRLLALALLLLSASAASQPAPSRMPTTESARMVSAGWVATGGTILLASMLEAPVLLAAAPLASGLTVYAVGEGYEREGSFAGAMLGAAAGAAVGGAVILASVDGNADDVGVRLPVLLVGGVLYAIVPSITSTIGYNLGRPTVLRTPDGGLVPGATLRVSL